jgi:hypothetical protein
MTADFAWPPEPRIPGPPDPLPLPLDALPRVLRSHVETVAGATQTASDMAAGLVLASVSASLRGSIEVLVDGRGWREPTNIYVACVADPGERKSPVFALATAPIAAYETELCEEIRPRWQRAQDAVAVAEAALKNAVTAAGRAKATLSDVVEARAALDAALAAVPVLPELLASDATPEAVGMLMAAQGGAIAILAPEAEAFAVADGRYADKRVRIDELLKAWSGEAIRVHRVGRPPVHVERPALTFGVTVQPAALEDLRNARVLRGRGLWARILWIVPPSRIGRRLTGRGVPHLHGPAVAEYGKLIRGLLKASTPGTLQTMELDPAALDRLYAFEAEIEAAMAEGCRLAGIRDFGAKMHGQAVRLAAILEVAARAEDSRPLWSDPIGPWAMDGAVRLVQAVSTHTMNIMTAAGADGRMADLIYVLRRIRELPEGSSVRDIHQAVDTRPSIAGADSPSEYLAELLDALVERDCVRLIPQPSTGGRPPSPRVELHPKIRRSTTSAVPVAENIEVVL